MRVTGLFAAAILLTGCSHYILIERSERFVSKKKIESKIICIDPQVRWVDVSNIDPMLTLELESWMKDEMRYASSKTGIEMEILDLNASSTPKYYQNLLSLKKELLQANDYQDTPLNFSKKPGINTIKKSVFIYPPLVAHDFTSLSKDYGTPYFSYMGFYVKKSSVLFYHLIVNTNTAETVYREIKSIEKGKLKKKYISQMVYDSLAMLKEDLK